MRLGFWKKQRGVTVKQERYVLAPLQDDRLDQQGVIRDGQRAQNSIPGLGTAAQIALALELGACDHVAKPFSLPVLLQRIRHTLQV
jgi:CheY-like chemotaxis protein